MLAVIIYLVPVLLVGGSLAWFFCRDLQPLWARLTLGGLLTLGLAVGFSSCSFYWGLVLLNDREAIAVFEPAWLLAAAVVFTAVLHRKREGWAVARLTSAPAAGSSWPTVALLLIFAAVLATALLHFAVYSTRDPHGVGDAVAIWNLHARFLHRTGSSWPITFRLTVSHVDYPLLLPACIARLWDCTASETTLVPQALALGFTFGTVAVTLAAVRIVRGPSQALLAAVVLLGHGFLLEHGCSQYADVPLAFYLVSTIALILIHEHTATNSLRLLSAAGLCAGCAAWTKNEGSLAVLSVGTAMLLVGLLSHGWRLTARRLGAFGLGLLPFLVTLLHFKACHAGHSDLVSGQDWGRTIDRLSDGSRYGLIAHQLKEQLLTIPGLLAVALAAHVLLVGRSRALSVRAVGVPLLTLAAIAAGYFLVYLTTPYPLSWHLQTSLDRLVLHIFPAMVLVASLLLGTIEESLGRDAAPAGS